MFGLRQMPRPLPNPTLLVRHVCCTFVAPPVLEVERADHQKKSKSKKRTKKKTKSNETNGEDEEVGKEEEATEWEDREEQAAEEEVESDVHHHVRPWQPEPPGPPPRPSVVGVAPRRTRVRMLGTAWPR